MIVINYMLSRERAHLLQAGEAKLAERQNREFGDIKASKCIRSWHPPCIIMLSEVVLSHAEELHRSNSGAKLGTAGPMV